MNTTLKNTSGVNSMKLQALSIEQLKEIVDGAPDGAEYFENYTQRYLKEKDIKSDYSQNTTVLLAVWCDIKWSDMVLDYSESDLGHLTKLSDIRAELLARDTQPDFAVGDLVVVLKGQKIGMRKFNYMGIHTCKHIKDGMVNLDSFPENSYVSCEAFELATPEEKAAGHRIDTPILTGYTPSRCSTSVKNPPRSK